MTELKFPEIAKETVQDSLVLSGARYSRANMTISRSIKTKQQRSRVQFSVFHIVSIFSFLHEISFFYISKILQNSMIPLFYSMEHST